MGMQLMTCKCIMHIHICGIYVVQLHKYRKLNMAYLFKIKPDKPVEVLFIRVITT